MRALLDVNVLIALFDPDHVFHERAHLWLEENSGAGIATCPLTENGVVRILSHPGYSKAIRITPAEVVRRLGRFCKSQDHEFWPDSLSLRDTEVFRVESLLGPRQLTDLYLLALAVKEGGCLATLDERITSAAVVGATAGQVVVI